MKNKPLNTEQNRLSAGQSSDLNYMKISVEVAMLLGAKFLSFEAFSAHQITLHVSAEPKAQLPPPQPGHRSCSRD